MLLADNTLRGDIVWEGSGEDFAGPHIGPGGLGFSTDIIENADATIQISLTDVANAWIRDMTDPIPTWRSAIPRPQEVAGLARDGTITYAIAASKTDPDVFAMIHQRRLIISTDRCQTWTVAAGVPVMGSNSANDKSTPSARFRTNRLTFDPVNDQVIYFCDPANNVAYRTLDRGATAPQVLAIPTWTRGKFFSFIFDKTSPTTSGRTARLWCCIGETLIYECTNGGSATTTWTDRGYPGVANRAAICDDSGRLIVCESGVGTIYTRTTGSGVWTTISVPNNRPISTIVQKPGDPTAFFAKSSSQTAAIYFSSADFQTTRQWPNADAARVSTSRMPLTSESSNDQISTGSVQWLSDGFVYKMTGWGILKCDPAQFTVEPKSDPLRWTEDTYGIETLVNKPSTFLIGPQGEDILMLSNGDRAAIRNVLPKEGRYGADVITPIGQGYGGGCAQALDNPSALYVAVWKQLSPAGNYVAKSKDAGRTWTQVTNSPAIGGGGLAGAIVAGNEGTVLVFQNAGGFPRFSFDDCQTFVDAVFYEDDAAVVADTPLARTGNMNFQLVHDRQRMIARDPRTPGRFFLYAWGGGLTGGSSERQGIYESIPGTNKFVQRTDKLHASGSFSTGYSTQLAFDPISENLYATYGPQSSASVEDSTVGIFKIDTNTWAITQITGTLNEPFGIDVGAPVREGEPMVLWACGFNGGMARIAFSRDEGATWTLTSDAPTTSAPYGIAASQRVFGLVCAIHGQSGPRIGRWMDALA